VDTRSNCWLSVILLSPDRAKWVPAVIAALEENDIESRRMWKPMHEQPVFKECSFFTHSGDSRSVSSDQFSRGICLPSGEGLCDGQLELIAGTIRSCL
jgi:pyridoxal phosphate-dependent aminotransferase EpsN